jgi:hypothetical protein
VLQAPDSVEAAPHVDNTPPGFDERPVVAPPVVPTPPELPAPAATPPPAAQAPARIFRQPAPPLSPPPVIPPPVVPPAPAFAQAPPIEPPEQPYDPAEPYDYAYRPADDDWGRRPSGMGPLAIGGFVLLGILAIGVGAFMSGLFSGGVAVSSPSGTPLVSLAPSISTAPSVPPSVEPSLPVATPLPSGATPGPFPDGFTARTEPCAEEPTSQDGCNSSGSTISGGSVWVWIGFRKGNDSDVLHVSILNASGTSVGDGSLSLGSIDCGNSCSGWARFKFSGLTVGSYTIKVDRNDTPAAEATFTVTG